METKKVVITNGIYNCDIGISVEEWKNILSDNSLMNENAKDALIKFYNEPEHKSTCKALGEKYKISAQSINGTVTAFTKAIQKKLNRFEIIGTDEQPTYWIIAMTGKHSGSYFEWTMREELVKAIEETLIKPKRYWIAKISSDDWFDFGLENNIWLTQQRYNIQTNSAVTNILNIIKLIDENDVLFLSYSNKIYAFGNILNTKAIQTNQVSSLKKVVNSNKHDYFDGTIIFTDNNVFYEELKNGCENWGQRIAVDEWKYYFENSNVTTSGVSANIVSGIAQMSLFEINKNYASSLILQLKNQYYKQNPEKLIMTRYIDLLKANKNLILTGAPGTGKTYLAKQIAISLLFQKNNESELNEEEQQILNKHFSFVQFHPSYDYTDFVEGLRAEDLNGQVIFNLHNGIFKSFCKQAIVKPVKDNFDEVYNNLINDISENEFLFETPIHKKKFRVEINSNKSCVAIPETNVGTRMSMTKEMIRDFVIYNKIRDWKPYVTAIGEYLKKNYTLKIEKGESQNLPFIFVVDEINRGEISKIFGELFFSIDPGYRGKNGKVKTQYANIQNGETIFDDELGEGWFYVPENVYIIGTMNDIDRSVESMDFAMRRRFAWKEIKAIDCTAMWNGEIDEWKDNALLRMTNLNQQIEKIQGLSSAYHIGPAYFLKLKNYDGDFDALWDNHLQSILFEYLRGLPNAQEELENLRTIYNGSGEI